jgi:multisubunit Na+/H+ antiporter MnhB subunit
VISHIGKEDMTKRERDRISALVCLTIAMGICFGSVRLSLGGVHQPGPGFFSFLIGAILGSLSLIVFLKSFKDLPGEEKEALLPNRKIAKKMLYVFITLTLYTIGMNYLGFFFSTLLFLGFLLRGIEPQRWFIVLTCSMLGTISFYGVFKYWLDVQLPGGILGF